MENLRWKEGEDGEVRGHLQVVNKLYNGWDGAVFCITLYVLVHHCSTREMGIRRHEMAIVLMTQERLAESVEVLEAGGETVKCVYVQGLLLGG